MSTVVYPALVLGDEGSGFQASVPDLPGCVAAAPSLTRLIALARDAVSQHLQRLADEGAEWPAPRPLSEIHAEPGAAIILVDVQVEDTPVRINISIGEQLLKRLDTAAEARGATRSGFIAAAVRASLGDKPRAKPADFDAAARQVREELANFGRRLGEGLGPDSVFSRSVAELDERVLETVRKAADNLSAAIGRRKQDAAARARDAEARPREEATQP